MNQLQKAITAVRQRLVARPGYCTKAHKSVGEFNSVGIDHEADIASVIYEDSTKRIPLYDADGKLAKECLFEPKVKIGGYVPYWGKPTWTFSGKSIRMPLRVDGIDYIEVGRRLVGIPTYRMLESPVGLSIPGFIPKGAWRQAFYGKEIFEIAKTAPVAPAGDGYVFRSVSDEISFGDPSGAISKLSQMERLILEDCQPAANDAVIRQSINKPAAAQCKIASLAEHLELDIELAARLDDAIRVIDPEGAIRQRLVRSCADDSTEVIRLIELAAQLEPLEDDELQAGPAAVESPLEFEADSDDDDAPEDEDPGTLGWLYTTPEVEMARKQEKMADAWLTAAGETRYDRYSSEAKMLAYELMSEDRPMARRKIAVAQTPEDKTAFAELMKLVGESRLADINKLRSQARTTELLGRFSGTQRATFWKISDEKKAELVAKKAAWVAAYPYSQLETFWLEKVRSAKTTKQLGFYWVQYYKALSGTVDMGRPAFLEHILRDALIARKLELTK